MLFKSELNFKLTVTATQLKLTLSHLFIFEPTFLSFQFEFQHWHITFYLHLLLSRQHYFVFCNHQSFFVWIVFREFWTLALKVAVLALITGLHLKGLYLYLIIPRFSQLVRLLQSAAFLFRFNFIIDVVFLGISALPGFLFCHLIFLFGLKILLILVFRLRNFILGLRWGRLFFGHILWFNFEANCSETVSFLNLRCSAFSKCSCRYL